MREKSATMVERLQGLAAFLPLFERPGFKFGKWIKPLRQEDGTVTLGFFSFSKAALSFVEKAYELGCVDLDFDWPSWKTTPEAVELRDNPDALARATPEQIVRLLTLLIRQDRFCEGELVAAYESGLLTRIVRRAADMASRITRGSRE